MDGCHECEKVVDPFKNLAVEMQKQLPFFEGYLVELREGVAFATANGGELIFTGQDFYKKFHQKKTF